LLNENVLTLLKEKSDSDMILECYADISYC